MFTDGMSLLFGYLFFLQYYFGHLVASIRCKGLHISQGPLKQE